MISFYRVPSSTWKQDRFLSRNSSPKEGDIYSPEPKQVKPCSKFPKTMASSRPGLPKESRITHPGNPLEAISEDFLRGSF